MSQFQYRKTFGLSYKEFLEEPLDIYIINRQIASIISQIEERELKKARRK